MTSAQAKRVLRVSVTHQGKTHERRFEAHQAVTLGPDAANTFVLAAPGLSKILPVLDYQHGQYWLFFQEAVEGRIQVGGVEFDLKALVASGKAKKKEEVYQFPLTDRSSGHLHFGPVEFKFDFVDSAVTSETYTLPKEVRGSFIRGLDRLFIAVLTLSLVVHGLFGIWILSQELPAEPEVALDQLPDRFAKVIMPSKVEPVKVEPEQKAVAVQAQKKEENKDEPTQTPSEDTNKADTKISATEKAEIAQQVASKGLLKVLTARGGTSSSVFQDVLGTSGEIRDVEAALKGAKGVDLATTQNLGAQGQKGGQTGAVANIGNLGTAGGGNVNLGNKGDVRVSGKVRDAAPEVESSDVDRAALTRYVKSRMSAIQSCYERELKRNPSLKGKLMVRFAITPSGRSSDIEIEENSLGSDDVAACIRNVIRTWMFPFKPESEVMVSYPFLFTPSN